MGLILYSAINIETTTYRQCCYYIYILLAEYSRAMEALSMGCHRR